VTLDEEGAERFAYLVIVVFGLAVLVMPTAFELIYIVFALPMLWELRRRNHDGL
jgi:hypothetical protein